MMARGFAAHSLDSKQLDRFRNRVSPAVAKDDSGAPRIPADAFRTERRFFARLKPDTVLSLNMIGDRLRGKFTVRGSAL